MPPIFLVVSLLLLAASGKSLALTQAKCMNSTFAHNDVRCRCTCPIQTSVIEQASKPRSCSTQHVNYDTSAGEFRSR